MKIIVSTFQPRETLTIITSYRSQYFLLEQKCVSLDRGMYVNYFKSFWIIKINWYPFGDRKLVRISYSLQNGVRYLEFYN